MMQDVGTIGSPAEARLVRHSDMVSCSVAFIDCKLPGSTLKENYSIIGAGVTQSDDQVVNIEEDHGFALGAAAMPNGVTNNLHIHYTAEVFIIFRGEWLFRWGADGTGGEIVGRAGDIVSMPTWIFRGFTNIGPDDGWIYTALGGDDTGGIIWHPTILNGAAEHGLFLSKNNMLVDLSKGDARPPEDDLIRPVTPEFIGTLRRYSVDEMRGRVTAATSGAGRRARCCRRRCPATRRRWRR
jgi:quercetin dioxygenase-like cupin family protein